MSGKLDQSLDQIMKDTKPARNNFRGRRPARNAKSKAKAAIAAPTGGIQKNKTATRPPRAAAPVSAVSTTGDSKIIVSNLPEDVTETQIKDYFGKTIGHVKRVLLTYGPQGRSRGVAQINFSNAAHGAKAASELDGVKVDNRAMKIEVVLGAKDVSKPSAPKGLADRMTKPKSAAERKDKPKTNGATTGGGAATSNGPRGKKAGRTSKPKKKTAAELDEEMMDYFGGDAGAAPATAQPAAAAAIGGDTGMVDEVM